MGLFSIHSAMYRKLRDCIMYNATQCVTETVANGHPQVDFHTNRKRVCDFLLVIIRNLGPIFCTVDVAYRLIALRMLRVSLKQMPMCKYLPAFDVGGGRRS